MEVVPTAITLLGFIDLPCRLLADGEALLVHEMVLHPVRLDGEECPVADVERDRGDRRTRPSAFQDLLREVEARRGRRDRTLHAGIDGLVPFQVALRTRPILSALDVGRQRGPPVQGQKIVERDVRSQRQQPALFRDTANDPSRCTRRSNVTSSRHRPVWRDGEAPPRSLPVISSVSAGKQEDFDQPSRLLPADEARRKNAGIVDDEDIPRPKYSEDRGRPGFDAPVSLWTTIIRDWSRTADGSWAISSSGR